MGGIGRLLIAILDLGNAGIDDEGERTTRRVFVGASLFVTVAAPLWGAIYIGYGEVAAGLIPSGYSVVTLASFVALWRFGGWWWFRASQLTLIFVLPIALMWTLGGFVPGSAVIIWSILAPLGALWGGRSREAVAWVVAFIAAVAISALIDPTLRDSNALPYGMQVALFALNLTFVGQVVFLLLGYFVGQKDRMIDIMQRNRELESAYLRQEISLRQSDKLATLGKLSAGLAHELNNPTSAVQQATQQLGGLLLGEERLQAEMAVVDLSPDEQAAVAAHAARIGARIGTPAFIDPLERSDREDELQSFLDDAGVDEAWLVAPTLVGLGLARADVEDLAAELRPDRFSAAMAVLASQYQRRNLLGSLSESTDRIVQMIRALKSYTHLDLAPRQAIDVHEGLDSTLLMLQNRLKKGIEVRRHYTSDLPLVEAYGGELNQVWTNILDNAIDAMDDRGTIELVTRRDGDHIVVELTDDGPGIPADLVETIFDPFVTTKGVGQGTGLGLNISHNIITRKHGGEITVDSRPGRTTFTIRLPISGGDDDADPPHGPATEPPETQQEREGG